MTPVRENQVTLTINGKKVTVPAGTLIVDAARQAGIDIPVFCYHPELVPAGMCRMCLVEIGRPVVDRSTGNTVLENDGTVKVQFGPKLETACTTPVTEAMQVVTDSHKVMAARKENLEFILTSHPLDCPICDKGGECALQNLTMAYGPGESRFLLDEKKHFEKHKPLGDLIILDRERCIQCGRCVRFQQDVAGDPVLAFYHRGRSTEIITNSEPGFDSIFSGNTTDICPVGALTTVDFRFGARPWEMERTASICSHCAVGCNLTYNIRREAVNGGKTVIKRVMPRRNEKVNDCWICDKGRFGYHYLESESLLSKPLVKKDGRLVDSDWDEALRTAERALAVAKAPLVLAGGGLSNEGLFNLSRIVKDGWGENILYSYMAGGDITAQIGLSHDSNLGNLGPQSAVIVVASDLHEEGPIWWQRIKESAQRGMSLIVLNTRPTRLDQYASHIIRYEPGHESETVRSLFPENAAGFGEEINSASATFTKATEGIIFYGSDGLGLEDSQDLADSCGQLLVKTDHFAKPNNGLVGVWHAPNLQGAWDMGFCPVNDLAGEIQKADVLVLAGVNPVAENPDLAEAIKRPDLFTICLDSFFHETAMESHVVLPVCTITEQDGTFTSGERRVQRFFPINHPQDRKADYEVAGHLANTAGLSLTNVENRSASLVMAEISRQVAGYKGIHFEALGQTNYWTDHERTSTIHYFGTSFENDISLGIQLENQKLQVQFMRLADDKQPGRLPEKGKKLTLLPITYIYDQNWPIVQAKVLQKRLMSPSLKVNLKTAEDLKLSNGKICRFELAGRQYSLKVEIENDLPDRCAFVGRQMGIPISGPQTITVLG